MTSNLFSSYWWLIIAALIAAYYASIFFLSRQKLIQPSIKKPQAGILQTGGAGLQQFTHELIGAPEEPIADQLEITLENDWEETETLEMVEDAGSALLKEAEAVVEKIQDVVNHIASNPPNLEEVYSKIKSIVSQYLIFQNTEYFDAINRFVAVTVERDCNLKFSEQELLALWS